MWKGIISIFDQILHSFAFKRRIESKMDAVLRRVVRLEILDAIKRDDVKTVLALFDEYSALGGNSYISLLVEKYKVSKEKCRRQKK